MVQWELLGALIDAGCFYLFYRLYKNASKGADVIKEMTIHEAGPELRSELNAASGNSLPYACVEGFSKALSHVLKSRFTNEVGVIRTHSLVEHRSKRTQGFWSDVQRVIKDEVNCEPFVVGSLSSPKDNIHVEDPLSAEHLDVALSTVYDHYEPTKDGALSRGLDRIFGEVTKGHQETERMLSVGVRLLGIGKLSLEGDKIVLSPPDNNIGPYILTSLSKPELVRAYASKARIFRLLAWVFGLVGAGLVSYWVYRHVHRWYEDYRMRNMMQQIRQQRAQQMAEGNNNGDENENRDPCVVCLQNPRELIVLDCGHLCLCSDCARALPEPRHCPICRGIIARLLPVYNS